MPTLSDYQSHPDWAKLTPEQKVKVADITFDKSYAKHADWQKMNDAQRQEAKQSYYRQNSIEPIAPPNEFIKSAVNKWQEQSSGGIVDTEEGTDWAGNLVGALAGGATNVGTGALIGAGIGSIVPVIGTAIGATVGGTIGAVAGGFGQSLRETQNAGKPFSELTAGDYGRAIIEGGINAVPVAGVGGKALTRLATGALFDAGLNAGASVAGQAIQKGEVDGMEVLQQGAFGAGGHLAGGIIQQQLGKRMAKAEAQAQAEQALQGVDASQVGVLPEGMAPPQADLSEILPYDDTPFDVNAFTQDRTTQVQTDLQAKIQEAVSLKAQGGHNQAKLIRTSLSKEMNTLAKNGDPLASTYAQALDEIDNQAKALKQKKNAPLDETAVLPEGSFDPNTAELGETRIDPNTGETVYYGGKITNEAEAPDLPDPFFLEELQRRDKVKTLEPIGTPVKPKFLKGDFSKVTLKDIEDVLSDQLHEKSNVGQAYAVDTLQSLGFKVDRLKLNAKGTESRAGENYRVKVAGKNVVFKGQDPFSTVINRLNKEHGVNITGSIARRISKAKNFDILNELVVMNGDDLDLKYSEQQGTQSQAFQALQEKLAGNQMANMDYPTNKAFAIQEAKTQELLNDLDKVNTPREFEAVQSRYQDVLNNSIYPEYTQEIITPKLEEAQVLLEGFTPLNQAKQDQLKARLERDLNQAQTPEDIARVAEELYSDGTMQALIDEDSFYESLGTKLQEAEERLNNPVRSTNEEDLIFNEVENEAKLALEKKPNLKNGDLGHPLNKSIFTEFTELQKKLANNPVLEKTITQEYGLIKENNPYHFQEPVSFKDFVAQNPQLEGMSKAIKNAEYQAFLESVETPDMLVSNAKAELWGYKQKNRIAQLLENSTNQKNELIKASSSDFIPSSQNTVRLDEAGNPIEVSEVYRSKSKGAKEGSQSKSKYYTFKTDVITDGGVIGFKDNNLLVNFDENGDFNNMSSLFSTSTPKNEVAVSDHLYGNRNLLNGKFLKTKSVDVVGDLTPEILENGMFFKLKEDRWLGRDGNLYFLKKMPSETEIKNYITSEAYSQDLDFVNQKNKELSLILNENTQVPTSAEIAQVAMPETPSAKPSPTVTARNVDDLTKVGKAYFGLNDEQAKAQAVVSDLIIQKIAERKGVSVKDAYDSIGFKKSNVSDLKEGAMFQDAGNILNDLNPTGGLFTDYTPESRTIAKLGENITTLANTAGKNPNDFVTIYRGSNLQSKINNGDFVTTNKQLAQDYAGGGKVLSEKVRYGDILDDTSEPLGEEYILRKGAFEEINNPDIRFQSQKGAMETLENGKSVIHALTDPDVSTPLHEIAHVYEGVLTDSERTAILDWAGHKDWQTDTSERFARGFEKYLSEGKAPNKSLEGVFESFKTWLLDIYKGITGSDIDLQLNTKMRAIYDEMLTPSKLDDALPPQKGGAEIASSGKGSPQARLDGKAQEIGFKNIKHLMQGYRAIGGDLTPAKVSKVLAEKPELQAVYDAFKPLTGKTDANGVPKYAEEIEFQQSLLEIARTPDKALDYENGTGRQQPLKQLIEKAPQDWNRGEAVKTTAGYDLLTPLAKKRFELVDRLMKQYKSMDVEIATEGGMSGKGGATNAIDAKKRQNITPISWAIHNDQIAVNAYNGDGHFAKYYLDLDERLVREGKEASRFLSDPVESTAPEFVGTYPNVYRDAIPFLLEDVLNRKPRQEGILTSEARDLLSTARAFKSKLDKEQQLQIKYGANVEDLKKIGHELRKLGTPENVVKLTDAIINKAGNKKKLTQNDIIAIKKTLEKDPSLKALKGMCDLFKLSTANLK